MRTSRLSVQPTLLTMYLNLRPCKVQSKELMHVNLSRVRRPKIPFCVALIRTVITFAYELGLERSLARWKANEKLHLKIAKTSPTPFRRAFRILPCRCETSRTTSSIEEDIIFMHTPNNPHSGSEPMPLHGPITRSRARQF